MNILDTTTITVFIALVLALAAAGTVAALALVAGSISHTRRPRPTIETRPTFGGLAHV
jgi:hypothetical protein